MFKHLKNFLIAIVLTFSFIGGVKALVLPNGIDINSEYIYNVWNTYFEGKTVNQINNSSNSGSNYNTPYDNSFTQVHFVYSSSNNSIQFYFAQSPSEVIVIKNSNTLYGYGFVANNTSTYALYPAITIYLNSNSYRYQLWNNISYSYIKPTDVYPNYYWNGSSSVRLGFNFDLSYNNEFYKEHNIEYDSNPIPTIFNFHLNGGHGSCIIGMHTPVIPLLYDDENFSISTDDYDIYDVLDNLEIEKDNMIFDGFFYDPNFTQRFSSFDNFDDHAEVEDDAKVINLYAKYRYKTVDDFLANTDFTTYTFDTNYDYAIINRGNNSDIVYMGLPFNSYNLEVYEYQENTGTYKNGASVCLVPIFNKGGWYMYELNTLFTNNQEVLIIPRYLFDELDPNSFVDPGEQYQFHLTPNAYVTYTNDLTHVTITNSQGQTIDTNLKNSFELSQQYQEMYAHEKDIYAQIKIFLNNLTRYTTAIRQLFEYLFNSLNSTIRNFIIFIVVIVLISAILKAIRRG